MGVKRKSSLLILTVLIAMAFPHKSEVPYAAPAQKQVAPEHLLFVTNEAFGISFRNPLGVFYDNHHDEILVADTGNHRVVILDGAEGYAKSAFTHWVRRAGVDKAILGEPRSIAVNSSSEIFIVDNLCEYVEVCDFRGTPLTRISLEEYMQPVEVSSGFDLKPVAVTVDPKDNLYIATSSSIYVFNNDLQFQRQLGSKGYKSSEFIAIMSLWVDSAGKIFVTDGQGLGLRVLAPDGEVLLAFGGHDAGFDNFSLPYGVITDRRGYIWVSDSLRHITTIFDADGKFLDYIGSFGSKVGQFAYPSGVATDRDGKIAVLERVGARLQCFELAQPLTEG